jgi:nucleotide-binding universal stress UspA family protein
LFKKILVAVDGSELSYKSVDYALDLAQKYSAQLKIVTVIDAPSDTLVAQASAFAPQSIKDHEEKLEKAHEQILLKAVQKAEKLIPKISVTKQVLEGPPAERIVETTKAESFDLIVMGSRGLGGIKEFILGSVSDKVADEAPCPVLIIK